MGSGIVSASDGIDPPALRMDQLRWDSLSIENLSEASVYLREFLEDLQHRGLEVEGARAINQAMTKLSIAWWTALNELEWRADIDCTDEIEKTARLEST